MVLEFGGYSLWNSRMNLVQKQVYNRRFKAYKPIVIAAVSKSFTNADFNQPLMHQFRNLVCKIKEQLQKVARTKRVFWSSIRILKSQAHTLGP